MPSRTLPTRFLTGAWRWEVPRRDVPVAARASSASVRTLEGPAPKRPSAGLMSAGIWISATSGSVSPRRNGTETRPFDETTAPARGQRVSYDDLRPVHDELRRSTAIYGELRRQPDRQLVDVVLRHHRLVAQLRRRDRQVE